MGYVMKGVQGGHQCAGLLKSLDLLNRSTIVKEEGKKMVIYFRIGQNRKSQSGNKRGARSSTQDFNVQLSLSLV